MDADFSGVGPTGLAGCCCQRQHHCRWRRRTDLPHPWLQGLLSDLCTHVEDKMVLMTGQDFLHIIAAMARLRFQPPLPWLHRFLGHSRNKLTSASPFQLTLLVRALSRIEYEPWDVKNCKTFAPWIQNFLLVSRAKLAQFSSEELANLISGLADLCFKPDREWMNNFSQVRACEAASCVNHHASTRFTPFS